MAKLPEETSISWKASDYNTLEGTVVPWDGDYEKMQMATAVPVKDVKDGKGYSLITEVISVRVAEPALSRESMRSPPSHIAESMHLNYLGLLAGGALT